jgi:hypothetical protein
MQTGQVSKRFYLAIIFCLVFAVAARTPLDTDMWWHLRAGEHTWQTGRPVTIDIFSYTRQGESWINHSWLSQLGMYIIYRLGGFLALGTFVALLAVISMALVYAQMEGHPLMRGFVLILASAVAAKVWSPRPQMFSLVLFGVVAYLLYLVKWRSRNRLWALVPIFLLWSNLHGGYVLGLMLIGAVITGEAINHVLGLQASHVLPWKGIGRLVLWGMLSGLVVVINPNGLAMWAIPFQTINVGILRKFIFEWASPDFHQLTMQPFLWLLFLTLISAGLSRRRLDGSDAVSVAGFAYLALLAQRNLGPFAMVAAPVLSRHLVSIAHEWVEWAKSTLSRYPVGQAILNQNMEVNPNPANLKRIINASIVILLASVAITRLYVVTSPDKVRERELAQYPVGSIKWIEANQPKRQLFNSYNWGGYLLWQLRDYPVFVDGRTDLYNDEILEDYLQIISGGAGCLGELDAYGVNVVLIEAESGLARVLEDSDLWVKTVNDEVGLVFVRRPGVTPVDISRY